MIARRARRRARAGLRAVGPDAVRGRLDRPGAPGDHPRRPRGGGQGPVPRHRAQHRVPTCATSALLRRVVGDGVPRPRHAVRSSRSCASGCARRSTTASRPTTSSCSPTTTRATRSSTSRTSCRELSTGAGAHHRAGRRRRLRRGCSAGTSASATSPAETIYRFVFRSLYRLHAFNGDPHPGNYLFHGTGRVTLPRLRPGEALHGPRTSTRSRTLVRVHRASRTTRAASGGALERAGFLQPGAPVPPTTVVDRLRPVLRDRAAKTRR